MIRVAQPRARANQEWHHIRLEAPQMVAREHERMKLLFGTLYMGALMPAGMNLWMAPDYGGSADIYISPPSVPLAGDLIRRYQARPCAPPSRPIVLIAGHQYGTQDDTRCEPWHAAEAAPRDGAASFPGRAVYELTGRFSKTLPYAWGQFALFVRRFAQAWALIPPRPRPRKEDA